MENKLPMQVENTYEKDFNSFRESGLAEVLKEKYRVRPYFEKYKWAKIASKVASYLFNVLSAGTAAVLVFFVVKAATLGLGTYLSITLSVLATLVFIIALEVMKRGTWSITFKDAFQFRKARFGNIFFGVFLTCISLPLSYMGGHKVIKETTPPPVLLTKDSALLQIDARMLAIKSEVAKLNKNTVKNKQGKSVVFFPSQKAISVLNSERLELQKRKNKIEARTDNKNDKIEIVYESETKLTALQFASFAFVCEFLFILCVWYMEKYDFRSYADFATVATISTEKPVESETNHVNTKNELQQPKNYDLPDLETEKGSYALVTKRIETVLEEMNTRIEQEPKQALKMELKGLKRGVQQYRNKFVNKVGKPKTAMRNIQDRVIDFENLTDDSLTWLTEKD